MITILTTQTTTLIRYAIDVLLFILGLTYITADNLAVLPENPLNEVESLATHLGYELNQSFYIEPIVYEGSHKDMRHHFPTPCTVKEALTRFFDIHGYPRHSIVAQFLPYVTDPLQKG